MEQIESYVKYLLSKFDDKDTVDKIVSVCQHHQKSVHSLWCNDYSFLVLASTDIREELFDLCSTLQLLEIDYLFRAISLFGLICPTRDGDDDFESIIDSEKSLYKYMRELFYSTTKKLPKNFIDKFCKSAAKEIFKKKSIEEMSFSDEEMYSDSEDY